MSQILKSNKIISIFIFYFLFNPSLFSYFSIDLYGSGGLSRINENNISPFNFTYSLNEDRALPLNYGGGFGVNYYFQNIFKINLSAGVNHLIVKGMEKNLSYDHSLYPPGTQGSVGSFWYGTSGNVYGDFSGYILFLILKSQYKLISLEKNSFWFGIGLLNSMRLKNKKTFSDNPELSYSSSPYGSTGKDFGFLWSIIYQKVLSESLMLNIGYENMIHFYPFSKGTYYIDQNSGYYSEFDLRSIDFNFSIGLEYKL